MDDFACLLRLGIPKEADALTPAALAAAGRKTDPAPTEAQKDAGNYRKGRAEWKGLPLVIETAKGQVRSGVGKDGTKWSITLKDAYGYIGDTTSKADDDAVDVFVCDEHLDSEIVFIINQNKPDGSFDEHKCILGCLSQEQAEKTYLRNYSPGWKGLGSVKAMTLEDFKTWSKRAPAKAAADKEEKRYLGRYKCPHCGGTNAYNGTPGTGTTFRGSGVCTDCDKGFSIVGMKLKPIGQGPEIVPTAEQIAQKKKMDDWFAKHSTDGYLPHLYFVKRAEDDDQPFTIAVDLDGTLAEKEEPFDPETIGAPIEKAIEYVRKFKDAGARIIIFTVRGDTQLVTNWLEEHDVPFDHINENPDQPEDSSGKVIADVYWDDRAFNAKEPDEHGPHILGLINEEEGGVDQSDGPVMMIQQTRTIITIHPRDLFAGLAEHSDGEDDEPVAGHDEPEQPAVQPHDGRHT